MAGKQSEEEEKKREREKTDIIVASHLLQSELRLSQGHRETSWTALFD